jgi:hypothetical protein
LDTLQALEARSAQAGKLTNMIQLAAFQFDKTRAKVAEQQKVVIELGTQIAARLEQQWWDTHIKRADEIKTEFDRLERGYRAEDRSPG